MQRPTPGTLAWEPGSDAHKASCYQAAQSQLPHRMGSARAWLFVNKPASTIDVRRVRMSDYTDPIWMSFIGSFGQDSLGLGADYMLEAVDANLALVLKPRRADTLLPRTSALDLTQPEPTFHVVLLFRPLPDVTRSLPEAGTGALVAVYVATGQSQRFEHLRLSNASSKVAPDTTGCHGYVIALQRTTGLSTKERSRLARVPEAGSDGWSSFEALLDLAFPGPEEGEALVRFLPEYLGPVQVST